MSGGTAADTYTPEAVAVMADDLHQAITTIAGDLWAAAPHLRDQAAAGDRRVARALDGIGRALEAIVETYGLTDDEHEGARLLPDLRRERGWSQQDLAEAIRARSCELGRPVWVDRSSVAHWERGDHLPGVRVRPILEDVLGASTRVLFPREVTAALA